METEKPKESIVTSDLRGAGGSLEFTIPKQLTDKLDWKEQDKLHLDIKNGKYGKFLVVWCYDKQKTEYEKQSGNSKL